jgi:DNA replication protein DnaC
MWLATCPPDFAGADWQGVLARRPAHSPDVLVPAEAWCETPVRSLLLMGDVGAGKTYLACAVARRLVVGVGAWATFTTVEGMFASMAPGADEAWAPSLTALAGAGVLVLDDVGAGRPRPTEWQAMLLNELLNRRWSSRRPTILTTNLGAGDEGPAHTDAAGRALRDYLGERSYDRLRDGAAVALVGPSLRGRRAPKGQA